MCSKCTKFCFYGTLLAVLDLVLFLYNEIIMYNSKGISPGKLSSFIFLIYKIYYLTEPNISQSFLSLIMIVLLMDAIMLKLEQISYTKGLNIFRK